MGSLKHLQTLLPEKQPEERVLRMWRAVETARRSAPQRRLRGPVLAFASAVAVAALVTVWATGILPPDAPVGPLLTETGGAVPTAFTAEGDTVQRFADDSSLRLAQGSSLRLVENTASEVSFSLGRGRVRFDIRPGGPRRWRVRSDGVTVTVLGTCFTMEKKDAQTTVAVARGKVLVRDEGAGQDRVLTAGESVTIGHAADDTGPRPEIAGPETLPSPEPPTMSETVASPIKKTEARRAEWRVHAEAGDFEEAYAELGAEGVATLTRKTTSVDELFKLADVARLSGHPSDAVAPLTAVIDDFPTDPRAGLAAYTLAKLYLEPLASPQKAFRTFDRAVELGLPAVLLEAAYFKKAEALFQISRPLGEWAAEEYFKRYPTGRYRKQLETRRNDAMTTKK